MAIGFNEIDPSLRTPDVQIEIDNRGAAGASAGRQAALITGYRYASSRAEADTMRLITGNDDADYQLGPGSQLCEMVRAFISNAGSAVDIYVYPQDAPAGSAASATVTVTAADAAAGNIYINVGGSTVIATSAEGDSADAIASSIAAKINDDARLGVLAAASGGEVTLTANHNGTYGNSIYLALESGYGRDLPDGITITITGFAGGAGEIDTAAMIAAMGEDEYKYLVSPSADASVIDPLTGEMARRFDAGLMIGGVVYAAQLEPDFNALLSYSAQFNSPFATIVDSYASLQPPHLVAAANAGVAAGIISIDPAKPLQRSALVGMAGRAGARNRAERETLLHNGLTPLEVTSAGDVQIVRQITTYQVNSAGVDDVSYLDVNTIYTAEAVRRYQRDSFLLRFPDSKFASTTTYEVPAGQDIVTVDLVRSTFLDLYRDLINKGLVEGYETYAASLVVEVNQDSPGRFDVIDHPNYIGQFRVLAVRSVFKLI